MPARNDLGTGGRAAILPAAAISGASRGEQARGIEQVNIAVSEMDRVVQRIASSAEESASSSEEMNAQSRQMKTMVGELTALVGGAEQDAGPAGTRVEATPDRRETNRPRASNLNRKRNLLGPGRSGEVTPGQVIPMDGEDEEGEG